MAALVQCETESATCTAMVSYSPIRIDHRPSRLGSRAQLDGDLKGRRRRPSRRLTSFHGIRSPVDEFGRSRSQGIDREFSKQDRVAGGVSELLDAGSDVDEVTDQRELQLPAAADSARDHHTVLIPMPIRSSPLNRLATRRWINTAAFSAASA